MLFTKRDITLIPFSIVWTSLVTIWAIRVLGVATGGIVLALPFILIGLYMVAGRFVYKTWWKRRTVYAVTDRRALIVTRGRKADHVESIYLDALPGISSITSRSGRGCVHLGTVNARAAQWENTGLDFAARAPFAARGSSQDGLGVSFFDIPNSDGVARLVRTLRAHHSASPSPRWMRHADNDS